MKKAAIAATALLALVAGCDGISLFTNTKTTWTIRSDPEGVVALVEFDGELTAAKEEDIRADGQAHATKACQRHNKTATFVSGQAEESTADLTRYRLVYTCD